VNEHFLARTPIGRNNRVFNQQLCQFFVLVDLTYKGRMSLMNTFLNKEGHNRFRDQISHVLLHNAEVALDQILSDPGFHDDSGAFLLL
jgi:hypothetical protein